MKEVKLLDADGNVNIYIMTWIKKHLKVSVPSPIKQEKNELNVTANRSKTKSGTNAGESNTTLSGGLDYRRGLTNVYARGDSNKNYSTGISMRNKRGNVSGGVNYNKDSFGNNIGANLKIKF